MRVITMDDGLGVHSAAPSHRGTASVMSMAIAAIGSAAFGASGPGPSFVEASTVSGLLAEQDPSPNLDLTAFNVSRMMGAGAIGDFNRDGRPDVFVLSGGSTPDQLFINQGGGFSEQAAAWGIDRQHIGIGCCVGDIDRDGWLDIFITSFGLSNSSIDPVEDHHALWRNNGDGTFTDIADTAGVRSLGGPGPRGWGPAFGDHDLDGDLDLAIPSWTGGGTRLFRNNGDLTFTDISAEAGLESTSPLGFSAGFADMDGDRYPELLVACDFGGSQYFRNNRDGTFTEITAEAGVGLDGNGMGHVIADLDGDGDQDWYVTSIFTFDGPGPHVPGTGNFLYQQVGEHTFEVSGGQGTIDGGWGWGVEAVDIDHDGRLDIIETNGWPGQNGSGVFEWVDEPCYVYRRQADGTYTDIAAACGLAWSGQGRGLVRFDPDLDGDQDIIVFAHDDHARYYRNTLAAGPDRGWIDVRLDTSGHPRLAPDGFGTEVSVRTGKTWHRRILSGQSSFASQSELSVHFGLGAVRSIDEVLIRWNDGSATRIEGTKINQHLIVASGFSSDLDADGRVSFADLIGLLVRFGSDDPDADLDASGTVDATDLMVLLGNWTFD